MKKNYLKPEILVEEILVETMIATSPGDNIGGNENENNDQGGFSSNDRRGGWGDLWN